MGRWNPLTMLDSELIQDIYPIAMALKASVFVIHYDGTYIEYVEAGDSGKTIASYEAMIGNKGMDLLPEPMQTTVKHYHQQAVQTGQPQRYTYASPIGGILYHTILTPYPEKQIIVSYLMQDTRKVV